MQFSDDTLYKIIHLKLGVIIEKYTQAHAYCFLSLPPGQVTTPKKHKLTE